LGVIHRDLKPHNVMLDGRGRVRITDFGLAGIVDRMPRTGGGSGTPGYMAPEQLRRQEVTIQSDLFALGLVLYEVFTGKRAFPADTREERRQQNEMATPSKPSSHVGGLNPAVERVILRCLEKEPKDRPRSAYEVVASLPGGDPLGAALAAGETPSPRMVAEGGAIGTLRPRTGALLVALVVAGLILVAVLNDRAALFRRVPLPEPPEELARQARQFLAELGYSGRPADSVSHFRAAVEYLDYVNRTNPSPGRWKELGNGRPAAIYFFYRESPEPLVPGLVPNDPGLFPGLVTPHNPPPTRPGMASVRLDGQGHLLELVVIPTADGGASAELLSGGWKLLLAAAGLADDLRTSPTFLWVPPCPCDQRAAWDGAFPERPDLPIHVEAAAYQGKAVFFRVGGTWTVPEETPRQRTAGQHLSLVVTMAVMVAAALLGLRNLRQGRGDRRGAAVLGGVMAGGFVAAWLLGGHHPATVAGELLGFSATLGVGGLAGLVAALAYLALEPAVRRRWPWRLTAWTRVLGGRLRDPLVGRDLLVGIVGGIGAGLLAQAVVIVPELLNLPAAVPAGGALGPAPARLYLLAGPLGATYYALLWFALAFLLALVLRRESLTWVGFVALFVLISTLIVAPPSLAGAVAYALSNMLILGLWVFLMARFGLWAFAAALVAEVLLLAAPLTWNAATWYFREGLLVAGVIVALAVYGFVTATGRQQLRQGFFGED
jgi:serine/threonine-protein kinase